MKIITDRLLRLHQWLLPERLGLGYLPYIWLSYCTFLFFDLWNKNELPAGFWPATLITLALFIPLYFMGYRIRGPRLQPIILAMVLLGVTASKWNYGASVYFIHACAFCAFSGSSWTGARNIGLVVAAAGLTVWLWGMHISFLGVVTLVGGMVGLGNIFFARMGEKNEQLHQSRQEIRRLAATAERERIARDLHDLLGHTLSTITLKSALAYRLVKRDSQQAAEEMKAVEQISRDALAQVRQAVAGYRGSSVLNELISARVALDTAGIELSQELKNLALPAEYENVLGLVLREALTNVVRHSQASQCQVKIHQTEKEVSLSVSDDGVGSQAAAGSGLNGMRERIENIGGQLLINGHGGLGFQLSAQIPLPDDGEDAPEISSAMSAEVEVS